MFYLQFPTISVRYTLLNDKQLVFLLIPCERPVQIFAKISAALTQFFFLVLFFNSCP